MTRPSDRAELMAAADDEVFTPLWQFPPELRKYVISERRRRQGFVLDDEPTGDPEFS